MTRRGIFKLLAFLPFVRSGAVRADADNEEKRLYYVIGVQLGIHAASKGMQISDTDLERLFAPIASRLERTQHTVPLDLLTFPVWVEDAGDKFLLCSGYRSAVRLIGDKAALKGL
jgi:hypothetical protein